MQTNTNFQSNDNYQIFIDDVNKTYRLCFTSKPPKNYQAVVLFLEQMEKALIENFKGTRNYDKKLLLNISERVCESRRIFFQSYFEFINNDRAVELQLRIENLIYPPQIFPTLSNDIIHFIFSKIEWKQLTPISYCSSNGKELVEGHIIHRAKVLGCEIDSAFEARRYLNNLFKAVNRFSKDVLPNKYICLSDEDTLSRIQRSRTKKFFVNFSHNGNPMIHFTVSKYPQLVRFFIDASTINQKGFKGLTPLMLATSSNQESNVKILLDNGAEVNLKDDNGNTPLHFTYNNNSSSIVKLLLGSKADINAINHDGDTPLHLTASLGSRTNIKFLESNGADLNIYNKNGERALSLIFNNKVFQACKLTHYENKVETADTHYNDY